MSAACPFLAGGIHALDVIAKLKRRGPHVVHLDRDLGVLESLQAVEPLKFRLAQHGIQSAGLLKEIMPA